MKKIKSTISISTLIICLLFPVITSAETIILKSGKTVEGKIIEKTDKYIKIDFQGMPLTYYSDEIESIDGKKLSGYSQEVVSNQESKNIEETKSAQNQNNPPKETGVVLSDRTQTEVGVEEYGQEIIKKVTYDFGPEHMVAELEPESKIAWLINSGNSSEKNRYFFAVLSMDQVKMLNSKYGGYRNWATCNSAGAGEGQNSISTAILITKDPVVERKLKQILKIALNSPVVEITGSKLKIVEYTYNKIKAAFSSPMVYYLVSDIEVIQSRYP